MTCRVMRRRSKVCGMTFCVHGPRSVKCMAIWEIDTNRILFYASTGRCLQITHIKNAPTEEFLKRYSDNTAINPE